jgi:hypothetical protein
MPPSIPVTIVSAAEPFTFHFQNQPFGSGDD